jgi:very-short-patch-repair endonuclease
MAASLNSFGAAYSNCINGKKAHFLRRVEGKTKRLAVECDGERWHTPEQLNSDLERQAILERLGVLVQF